MTKNSFVMNKIDDILKGEYYNTITYYLNNINNMSMNITKEETVYLLSVFSYINSEIKNNIQYTILNNTIMKKIKELKELSKEKIPDQLDKLLCSIELHIHIYQNKLCCAKSIHTLKLCDWFSMYEGGMCISHHIYYKSREDVLKKYLDRDVTSLVIGYLIE